MSADDRYDGRPFLRLLDCYVLRAVGQLGEDQAAALRMIEPQLASVYGEEMAWHDLVAKQMEFPEGMEVQILDIWLQACAQTEQLGIALDPAHFTRQFVDANFL